MSEQRPEQPDSGSPGEVTPPAPRVPRIEIGEPVAVGDGRPDAEGDGARSGDEASPESEPSGADPAEPASYGAPGSGAEPEVPPAQLDEPADHGAVDSASPAEPEVPAAQLGEPAAGDPAGISRRAEPGQPGMADQGLERARAEWSEIQVLFVDNPRASVERALQAVNHELVTILESVRPSAAEVSPAPASGDTTALAAGQGDTERLRVALRSCRAFWEDLVELGGQLAATTRVTGSPR